MVKINLTIEKLIDENTGHIIFSVWLIQLVFQSPDLYVLQLQCKYRYTAVLVSTISTFPFLGLESVQVYARCESLNRGQQSGDQLIFLNWTCILNVQMYFIC